LNRTATQVIAEAAKAPVYTPSAIAGLLERLGLNDKALAVIM